MFDFNTLKEFYAGKRVLVTGGVGTVGVELSKQLLALDVSEARLLDNRETEVFNFRENFNGNSRLNCFMGDIRDFRKIERLMKDIDVVFHVAAMKHVIISEYNPFDAVQTNIIGTQNIIEASLRNEVKQVIYTSSDKAVNPTNVMGTSKLMGERLITAANAKKCGSKTIFSSTRFGNIVGSRGSVVPIFKSQIKEGGPVTLTDERMTRFIMSPVDACRLVLESALLARGGEVFVTKMPVIRIKDLATAMINILSSRLGCSSGDISIDLIGSKPGEKLYEELMSNEEKGRAIEIEDYFVILPAFRSMYESIDYHYPGENNKSVNGPYISSLESPMTEDEIISYLLSNGILEEI